MLVTLFATLTATASDMPSGAELLYACRYAQEHGYDNPRGMLCIWYVTPCDCETVKGADVPRVCLPPGIEHGVLAQQVISGLKDNPGLQVLGAESAAAQVLAPIYPCER